MNFFPDPRKQDQIHFIFAKSLSYRRRMILVLFFIFSGLLCELLFSFTAGLLLLTTGMLLSLIKGYKAIPDMDSSPEEWSRVTEQEYHKIIDKQNQLKDWDSDVFDITNLQGGLIFIFFTGIILYFAFFLKSVFGEAFFLKILLNITVIILPQWFTGVRTYLKKDRLIIKIKLLLSLMKEFSRQKNLSLSPMLSIRKTKEGKGTPHDVRLMIKFNPQHPSFMGIQVQISINDVQGCDYPYLYTVLIAKKNSGFFEKSPSITSETCTGLTVEKSSSEDVDIIVIRQTTSKTSGYHTSLKECLHIVQSAITTVEKLIIATFQQPL